MINTDKNIMKKILLILFVLLLPSYLVFSQTGLIKWNNNISYAQKLSISNDKPMVVFFMDLPAGTLSRSVYDNTLSNNLIVEKINSYFIPVLIRGDALLQRQYNIKRLPTLMVVSVDGTEIDRLEGVIGIDQAYAMLESAQMGYSVGTRARAPSTTNTTMNSNIDYYGDSDATYTYATGSGTFIKTGKTWIHRTDFYEVLYTETRTDEGHHYITSENYLTDDDRKVNLAIPRVTPQNASGKVSAMIWIWDYNLSKWNWALDVDTVEGIGN